MRIDKLTTKFQEALADAQSLALGNDHAYIEPVHVLAAMLRQQDGPGALLQRAGVQVPALSQAAEAAVKRLPQVSGQEQVQVGRDLVTLQVVPGRLEAMANRLPAWIPRVAESGLAEVDLAPFDPATDPVAGAAAPVTTKPEAAPPPRGTSGCQVILRLSERVKVTLIRPLSF